MKPGAVVVLILYASPLPNSRQKSITRRVCYKAVGDGASGREMVEMSLVRAEYRQQTYMSERNPIETKPSMGTVLSVLDCGHDTLGAARSTCANSRQLDEYLAERHLFHQEPSPQVSVSFAAKRHH